MSARVGTPTPRSPPGVKGRQGVVPPLFQGRAHRHRLRVSRHDRDDAAGSSAPAKLVDQPLGLLEVTEHAMTQHGGEASTMHRLGGVLAVGLYERHPSPGLIRQPLESLLRFAQHRRRRIKQGHLVAGSGQRKQLMARAAADIEHWRRRRRQMLQQLLVQHVRAYPALRRGISLIGEGSAKLAQVSSLTAPAFPRTKKERSASSLPLPTYSASGVLPQGPGRAAESPAEARTCGTGVATT